MVSVGQFHRQAFQPTHLSFEKGRWQSIWRSLNIRKTMIALSSQSKIQRYTFRAQLNPDRLSNVAVNVNVANVLQISFVQLQRIMEECTKKCV